MGSSDLWIERETSARGHGDGDLWRGSCYTATVRPPHLA